VWIGCAALTLMTAVDRQLKFQTVHWVSSPMTLALYSAGRHHDPSAGILMNLPVQAGSQMDDTADWDQATSALMWHRRHLAAAETHLMLYKLVQLPHRPAHH
jgi:hypothetical protein